MENLRLESPQQIRLFLRAGAKNLRVLRQALREKNVGTEEKFSRPANHRDTAGVRNRRLKEFTNKVVFCILNIFIKRNHYLLKKDYRNLNTLRRMPREIDYLFQPKMLRLFKVNGMHKSAFKSFVINNCSRVRNRLSRRFISPGFRYPRPHLQLSRLRELSRPLQRQVP